MLRDSLWFIYSAVLLKFPKQILPSVAFRERQKPDNKD